MGRRTPNGLNPTFHEMWQAFRADYDMAKKSRFRRTRSGVSSVATTGDFHFRSEAQYFYGMELARDFDRNNGVVGQAVTRLIDNVLPVNMRPQAKTGDVVLDADLEARWEEWSENPALCDAAGERDFHSMCKAVKRAQLVDGDMINLPLRDGTIQNVEAHRCRTPSNTKRNVVLGVLCDDRRKHLEYWISREDIAIRAALTRVSDVTQYQAWTADGRKNVFHVYDSRRVSQTRGVSAFAPIADTVGMWDDIQFAKLVQQQVASCWVMIRRFENLYDRTSGAGAQTGARTTDTLSDGTTRITDDISPGMEMTARPGEIIEGFSPNIPNPTYFDYAALVLTTIAVNLDLPLAVMLLDPTKTNFSGWRGATDQAKRSWDRQYWELIKQFARPAYEWKVLQWADEDPAIARAFQAQGVNPLRHKWAAPYRPYIEPYKDAQADALRLSKCLTSPRQLHAERGHDWEEIASEIVADNAFAIRMAKAAAIEINSEFDDENPVHWRELIALPTPDMPSTIASQEVNEPVTQGGTTQ